MTARIPYNTTAPGAPVRGLATPDSRPPNDSPNHHTTSDQAIETTRAAFRERRQAIPMPISSCSVAKRALRTTGLLATIFVAHNTDVVSHGGLPCVNPASMSEEKDVLNM